MGILIKSRFRLGLVAVLALGLTQTSLHSASHIQQQPITEEAVKAALLYKFTKFVTWPAGTFASPNGPLRICVLGEDPFGPLLDQTMIGKTVNGRKISVLRRAQAAELSGDCHVAYISSSERARLPTILQRVSGMPILLISDINAFAQRGGMIGLVRINNKIRFAINKAVADRAGLQLNAQMLNLAIIVAPRRGNNP